MFIIFRFYNQNYFKCLLQSDAKLNVKGLFELGLINKWSWIKLQLYAEDVFCLLRKKSKSFFDHSNSALSNFKEVYFMIDYQNN